MNPKLSIILPSLRSSEYYKCSAAIKINSFLNYEIILVSSAQMLDSVLDGCWNKNIKEYVLDNKLIGTTYAIEKGLEKATGEYIVALSDDARVCPHWDENMINFLETFHPEEINIGNFRVFDNKSEMPHIGYYGKQFSMFPIMKRKNIELLGSYFSTEFNAYYSDPDLGMRVNELGFIRNCPSAFIYHSYNPDKLHLENKSKYWKHDEEVFIKKWGHLGKFNGCEVIKCEK